MSLFRTLIVDNQFLLYESANVLCLLGYSCYLAWHALVNDLPPLCSVLPRMGYISLAMADLARNSDAALGSEGSCLIV